MEIFRTLMMIYITLIVVNIILTFSLWRSTKSKHFAILNLHWLSLLLIFFIQKTIASHPPLIHAFTIIIPNIFVNYTLCLAFTSMLNIPLSFKKYALVTIAVAPFSYLAYKLNLPSLWFFFPVSLFLSTIYFYVVYQALRYHREQMNFSQKAITVLLIIFAFHSYTYGFFQHDLELLSIGFSIAIAIFMAIAILFPAAIIEKMSSENAKLLVEMKYKAKLTQSAKLAVLGEMAGGLAHEINNPLSILSLTLKKAHGNVGYEDKKNLTELIEKCQSNVDRMSKIVKGLMIFSREETGSQFSQVDVKDIVEDTTSLCSEKLKNYSIDFEIIPPKLPTYFIGSRIQISQVLLNLVNNSFDAVVNLEVKWIKVEVVELGDKLEFSVTDSGKGIDKKTQEKLFQPFFTTKEVGRGIGLGLSISRGIIESHGGTLNLDPFSPYTRFFFLIPKYNRSV